MMLERAPGPKKVYSRTTSSLVRISGLQLPSPHGLRGMQVHRALSRGTTPFAPAVHVDRERRTAFYNRID